MGRRLTIGSRAVAVAILAEVLEQAADQVIGDSGDSSDLRVLADKVVALSWDVEYKPNAEKLILTLNAGIEAPDRFRSTPEDQPARPVALVEDGCPYISNGVQCALSAGHAGAHDVG